MPTPQARSAWGNGGDIPTGGNGRGPAGACRLAFDQLFSGAQFGLGLVLLLPARLAMLLALAVAVTAIGAFVLVIDSMFCGCRCAIGKTKTAFHFFLRSQL